MPVLLLSSAVRRRGNTERQAKGLKASKGAKEGEEAHAQNFNPRGKHRGLIPGSASARHFRQRQHQRQPPRLRPGSGRHATQLGGMQRNWTALPVPNSVGHGSHVSSRFGEGPEWKRRAKNNIGEVFGMEESTQDQDGEIDASFDRGRGSGRAKWTWLTEKATSP